MAGKKRKPRAGKEGWRPCVGVEGRLLCRQGGRAGGSEVGVKTRGGAAAGAGTPETCLSAVPTHALLETTTQVQGEA